MKTITVIFGFLITLSATASIKCHTPRMDKTFKIEENKISFYKEEAITGRNIASVLSVRTRKSGNGFTKILNLDSKKHTIFIKDVNKFSDLDDYIIVRNRRGHEMTYPLSCK